MEIRDSSHNPEKDSLMDLPGGRERNRPGPAPDDIEATSMAIVERLLGERPYSPPEMSVVKRVVHTTGDPDFADLVRFGRGAVAAGTRVLDCGASIFTDVSMVRVGIDRRRLARLGGRIFCRVQAEDVRQLASKNGITRSSAAMEMFNDSLSGHVVAIGNAPTALETLCDLIRSRGVRPALVVGTPVGFVGAARSKERLIQTGERLGIPYITVLGTRGGSAVAACIVNALIRLAVGE